jgi:predicted nucleotidyltransferase
MIISKPIGVYRETNTGKQKQLERELELRQQKGWQIARKAAQLLKQKFAVYQVFLLGSLLDIKKMHRHSDIDLAVWGLAEENYYQAVAQLQELDSDFSIDLIQFESASLSLQEAILTRGIELDRAGERQQELFSILSNNSITMALYAPLIGEIRQDLTELETLTQKTAQLLEKVINSGDEDYLGTIALNLHSFYTGVERIFREIARTIDGSMPEGGDWHRRLLRQMSAEIPNLRPPAITLQTRTALEEYCAFRHVVRNIYTFNLRLDRIQNLAAALPQCYALLRQDCENFCEFLEQL